jgi:DHA2 family multidrug resistance protein
VSDDAAKPPRQLTAAHRRAILISMTFTIGTYVLTVTVANVALPQLQGAFAATRDEITWVVTSNLLATAIATPMSGWLNNRFGRRPVMLWAASIFAIATTLCGLSNSLGELVVFRAVQGFAGAPLLPLGQAIILEVYPKASHGRVIVLWSIGVTLGAIAASVLGGYAVEDYSWRWVFLMVVPFAVICVGAIWVYVPAAAEAPGGQRLDWIGFLCLAVAVSGLQLMLDRGQRLDWFDSNEIVLEAIIAVVAFYLFAVHVLTADRPFLNPRLLLDRNYAIGILLGLAFGMLYFSTFVLQPSMLQDMQGYPASLIGIMQATRGIGMMFGSIIVLVWTQRYDPRLNLFLGFLAQAIAGFAMAGFDVNMTAWAVAWTTALQGFGIGLMWSPITIITFATLAPRHVAEAASVFHLLRNVGSSVHIAISATIVVRSGRASYSELVEVLNPFNKDLAFDGIAGAWDVSSSGGLAALSAEVGRQANMIGYINAYYAYALLAIAVLPLVFLARRPPAE